jgi:tetratricopeptide (TPR) repeat protein
MYYVQKTYTVDSFLDRLNEIVLKIDGKYKFEKSKYDNYKEDIKNNDNTKALEKLRVLTKNFPDEFEYLYNRYLFEAKEKNYFTALDGFLKVVKKNPKFEEAYLILGMLYLIFFDFENAKINFQKALKLVTDDKKKNEKFKIFLIELDFIL